MAGGLCYSCSASVRLPMLLQSKLRPSVAPDAPQLHLITAETTTITLVLKIAVSGVTELLRVLSSFNKATSFRIDEVVMILKSDYENAYFVTGTLLFELRDTFLPVLFLSSTLLCVKELYSRNLKLLVPFFESPSIGLERIENGINSEASFVLATWKLRTYLKLPWRPRISIDGSMVYDLDDKFKIVRHADSWNVSAIEAIGQLFTPT